MKVYCLLFCWPVCFCWPDLSAQKITATEYINIYRELAISEMNRSGIPASITLAQGMLESANGNSRLALAANNHFGIKCHGWEGNEIYHDDNEKNECFRHYKSAKDSYLDHTDFLMTRSRYAFLFEYKSTDYKNWAKGLRKAGYATDPNYSQRLIDLIERYDLHRYDEGVKLRRKPVVAETTVEGKPADDFVSITVDKYPVRENNRTDYILAREGDTYASLTREMEMMPWQLPKYNETQATATLREGQVIYVQPKRRRAESGKDIHVALHGETMYDISQKYAIKLSRLYVLNRMETGTEPTAGDALNLRKKKKK